MLRLRANISDWRYRVGNFDLVKFDLEIEYWVGGSLPGTRFLSWMRCRVGSHLPGT